MTRLAVIIVSYKVRDLVIDCLRSVFAAAGSVQLEVFVVDNASDDGTVERVQHEFPSVRVIANSQNLGFPLANNQALAESSADVVLLLNPDTTVHEGALLELVEFFKRQTAGVVAGLNVRNADGTHQDCIHALPNFRSLVFSVLRIDRTFASSPFFNAYAYAGVDLPEVQQVGYVTGAALALNRMALEQLGGLDANLFWYEDIDLCCRAWKLGFPVYFLPKARVTHFSGQSRKRNIRRVLYHQHVSRVQYFRKHSDPVTAWLVTALTVVELSAKTFVRSVQFLGASRRSECRLRLAGYLDALGCIVAARTRYQIISTP